MKLFDCKSPDSWLDAITKKEASTLNSLCKSLFHSNVHVNTPETPVLCQWGMTGEWAVQGIPDEPKEDFLHSIPDVPTLSGTERSKYMHLVEEDGAYASPPWSYAVAAFKYAGGKVPPGEYEGELWEVRHIYERLAGDTAPPKEAGYHYTQSAGLVAVHPNVLRNIPRSNCVIATLQARSFATFGYDPENLFAPNHRHNNCGFVNKCN